MSSSEGLPELFTADLDVDGLRSLALRIEAEGTVLSVRTKGGEAARSAEVGRELSAAVEELLAARTRGVQVRYRFDGVTWADTIVATTSGFKLHRIRQDDG